MSFRDGFREHGLHRVIEPEEVLPQAAQRLDSTGPPYANEIEIDVSRLNIDSASFNQISDSAGGEPAEMKETIRDIVGNRGKMENPVTGSGGMLQGTVASKGPSYNADVEAGDSIATLVSLTLTPIEIHEIHDIEPAADQVVVDATAYLWETAPVVEFPSDIPQPEALSVFDVCGISRHATRLAEDTSDIAILGMGKSGMLAAFAARRVLGESGKIYGLDLNEGSLPELQAADVLDDYRQVDATNPVAVLEAVEYMTGGQLVGGALNTCNVPDTEVAPVLCVREKGTAFYFNMATDFSKVALGAEGVARDVELRIGNGYAENHAQLAVELYRDNELLQELWPV
jgi:L-erythro-3,5-diaminohexanoate dehydrogenase